MGIMSAHAQFGQYGVRAGVGIATMDDDLTTVSPILGATVGGYINFTFAKSESVLAETFYLQTGLNLNRRGSVFEEHPEKGSRLMYRHGFYHAYYLQLPILACVQYELPIRASGHIVGFYVGPTVSYGLFGRFADRMITPGVESTAVNYDLDFNGTAEQRKVFNHLNRLDVSLMLGLTYQYKRFTASLYLDRGFLATSEGDDILRIIEGTTVDTKIPNGHNVAYMLSVSYALGSFSD